MIFSLLQRTGSAGPMGGAWGVMAEGLGGGGAQAQVYKPLAPIVH
jgi:hypothetical protein